MTRPDRLGAELGGRLGGRAARRVGHVVDLGRSGQAAPVLELLDDPGDRGGVLGQPAQALLVGPAR